MAQRPIPLLSDQLRSAIRNADVSVYRISQETGVDPSVLSKFLHRERGMSLASIDAVASYLGLELVVRKNIKD